MMIIDRPINCLKIKTSKAAMRNYATTDKKKNAK